MLLFLRQNATWARITCLRDTKEKRLSTFVYVAQSNSMPISNIVYYYVYVCILCIFIYLYTVYTYTLLLLLLGEREMYPLLLDWLFISCWLYISWPCLCHGPGPGPCPPPMLGRRRGHGAVSVWESATPERPSTCGGGWAWLRARPMAWE